MSSVVLTRAIARSASSRIASKSTRAPVVVTRRTISGPADRPQGQDALVDLDPKKKMANYGMAVGCVAFVTGVWYYSISAVGKGDGEIEELERAAQKVTVHQSGYKVQQQQQTTAQTVVDGENVDVVVAAPKEIAEKEERAVVGVVGDGDAPKRSGWRRVVFFWRKD